MRRSRRNSVLGALISTVAACLVLQSCGQAESIYRVGAVLPLTGSAAVWGINAQRGMDLALDQLNANRPVAQRLSIAYEDSRSEATSAVSALQKLITAEHVQSVIGDIASSSVLAMAPVAESNKVLLLSPGASNPEISHAGQYVFRNWQSDALEAQVDAQFAYAVRGWRSVAILSVSNAYGSGLSQEFKKAFAALGGVVAAGETFDQGATDLRGQLTRLKRVRADAIYLPGYPPEMAVALKQMRELGLSLPILSVQAFDDPEIIARAGKAAEGVVFSVPRPPDDSTPLVSNFRRDYKNRYGLDPGVCSDTGYDAIRIIAWAMDRGAHSGEEFRKSLEGLRDFPGAAGPTTFDENGDVVRPFVFKTVKDGKAIEIPR